MTGSPASPLPHAQAEDIRCGQFNPAGKDNDSTRRALQKGRVCLVPQFRAVHAWHRDPAKRPDAFMRQLKSMMLYFRKWGFRLW